ncbi:MAG: FecR domain-containing protein [Pararobbsia sp.]
MRSSDPTRSAIEAQAQAWLVRMRSGTVTPAELQAFKRWCAEDPEHAQIVRALRDVWTTLRTAAAEFAEEKPAARAWPPSAARAQVLRPGRRAFVGFAVAAGASWLALRPPLQLWPALGDFAADYRTGTGEQRRVAISERVVVEMNTQTRLDVLASRSSRDGIRLLAGEAEVIAAAWPAGNASTSSPFLVVAGRGRLQAQTARFNVRRTGDQVCVTCLSGSVALDHPDGRRTLLAAQQLVYDDSAVHTVSRVNAAAVTAWRRGVLVFDRMPLSKVVDEINRYRPGKVILRNAALADNQVQLQFPLARVDDGIHILCQIYGMHETKLPGNIALIG